MSLKVSSFNCVIDSQDLDFSINLEKLNHFILTDSLTACTFIGSIFSHYDDIPALFDTAQLTKKNFNKYCKNVKRLYGLTGFPHDQDNYCDDAQSTLDWLRDLINEAVKTKISLHGAYAQFISTYSVLIKDEGSKEQPEEDPKNQVEKAEDIKPKIAEEQKEFTAQDDQFEEDEDEEELDIIKAPLISYQNDSPPEDILHFVYLCKKALSHAELPGGQNKAIILSYPGLEFSFCYKSQSVVLNTNIPLDAYEVEHWLKNEINTTDLATTQEDLDGLLHSTDFRREDTQSMRRGRIVRIVKKLQKVIKKKLSRKSKTLTKHKEIKQFDFKQGKHNVSPSGSQDEEKHEMGEGSEVKLPGTLISKKSSGISGVTDC